MCPCDESTAVLRGGIVNGTYGNIKTYTFTHFYEQYLELLTMIPRNSVHAG